MEEVCPEAEARVFTRPMLRIETYCGPIPQREHSKVCLSQIVNSEEKENTIHDR
jgi:hypothetical protein